MPASFNENLDLKIEVVLNLTPQEIWKAWTDKELFMKWFCPRPWKVTDCILDLTAGGQFFTEMSSPEDDRFPSEGCFLKVIPNQEIIWTSVLQKDYRPNTVIVDDISFTGEIHLKDLGDGKTMYIDIARHPNEGQKIKHESMGFAKGWTVAAEQMEELMKSLR